MKNFILLFSFLTLDAKNYISIGGAFKFAHDARESKVDNYLIDVMFLNNKPKENEELDFSNALVFKQKNSQFLYPSDFIKNIFPKKNLMFFFQFDRRVFLKSNRSAIMFSGLLMLEKFEFSDSEKICEKCYLKTESCNDEKCDDSYKIFSKKENFKNICIGSNFTRFFFIFDKKISLNIGAFGGISLMNNSNLNKNKFAFMKCLKIKLSFLIYENTLLDLGFFYMFERNFYPNIKVEKDNSEIYYNSYDDEKNSPDLIKQIKVPGYFSFFIGITLVSD